MKNFKTKIRRSVCGFILMLITVLSCQNPQAVKAQDEERICFEKLPEKTEEQASIRSYYQKLPQEMKRLHMQGLANESDVVLDTIVDEANHYFALQMNYHGELYLPFELKAYYENEEAEPVLVINQYVWDVGDPFYEAHFIQFDSNDSHYETVMSEATKAISGREQFFTAAAWKQVERIFNCQQEMDGATYFPDIYFHVQRHTNQLECGLDDIEGFMDWCGLDESEWQATLQGYEKQWLSWNAVAGIFDKN